MVYLPKTFLAILLFIPILITLNCTGSDVEKKTENREGQADNRYIQAPATDSTSINSKDNTRLTGLHSAAKHGKTEKAKELIAKGADVNAKDKSGNTPLYWAVLEKHNDITALLIEKGADVNATPEDFSYVQSFAIRGDKRILELLIKNGAKVDKKEVNGRTPLCLATMIGYKQIVELLIKKGADVNSLDRSEGSILDWAIWRGHKDIADLLRSHGAKTGEELKKQGNKGTRK
ncbi:MAG: ankyrin repeat domain-containing protein [Planctomycetota bacterium]|nr:MAG: ankyrin repeat domain-containing protein [Planctomycetota bacterium]